MGKFRSETMQGIINRGRTAGGQLGTLNTMSKQLDSPGFYSGTFGEPAKNAVRALASLGFIDPSVSKLSTPAEVFSSLSNKLVVERGSGA